MANDTSGPLIRLDTFGADVTICSGNVRVKSILVTAYTSAKGVTFIDSDGAVVWLAECPAGSSINWLPPDGFEFDNGLVFDESGSDLAAGDFVFIYLA